MSEQLERKIRSNGISTNCKSKFNNYTLSEVLSITTLKEFLLLMSNVCRRQRVAYIGKQLKEKVSEILIV